MNENPSKNARESIKPEPGDEVPPGEQPGGGM